MMLLPAAAEVGAQQADGTESPALPSWRPATGCRTRAARVGADFGNQALHKHLCAAGVELVDDGAQLAVFAGRWRSDDERVGGRVCLDLPAGAGVLRLRPGWRRRLPAWRQPLSVAGEGDAAALVEPVALMAARKVVASWVALAFFRSTTMRCCLLRHRPAPSAGLSSPPSGCVPKPGGPGWQHARSRCCYGALRPPVVLKPASAGSTSGARTGSFPSAATPRVLGPMALAFLSVMTSTSWHWAHPALPRCGPGAAGCLRSR